VLNTFLAEKGVMFAGGHCPDVGLGGFLLQGGRGWNCKVGIPISAGLDIYLTVANRIGAGLASPSSALML
jgi:hypothetical protein